MLRQFFKFSSVGVIASIVHVLLFTLLVQTFNMNAQKANIIAFVFAFNVSFYGNYKWTFSRTDALKNKANTSFLKFGTIAGAGFGFNAGYVWVFENILNLQVVWASIPMLIVTPIFTFLLARLWAFK